MDEQVNPLERDHSLSVVLPGGLEKNATVHGSKPVMDLLVTLCGSYHLNPSDYTVEVLSSNKNMSVKPNLPIGLLEAEKIVLKPKGVEEKTKGSYMPEATVRLLINYNKSHKAVVRVNPKVPLEILLPVVCDKCEFNVETTILLRDSQSKEPLDLSKTLNNHGLREVFAKDTASKEPTDHQHHKETPEADLPNKEKTQKDTGFFSLFRRKKKKPRTKETLSAPASPGLTKQVTARTNAQALSSCNTLPADMPKKRQAPQPPMGVSQSVPSNLGTCHLRGSQGSADSTLRSTKRRAPAPPFANPHQELQADTQVKGAADSLNTLEELRESDESDSFTLSLSSSSSPCPSQPSSSSSFARVHEVADPHSPLLRGKDISDARSALAKVLTSSISKGTLVKHLRNSATFPKLYNGSTCISTAQRHPDDGGFCDELDSVLKSNLPTEPEWEDPVQRKGTTTFKVIPSKKQKSPNPELNLDNTDEGHITAGDNPENEDFPETKNNEIEEKSCAPNSSETETPLPFQELSSQIQTSEDSPQFPHDLDTEACPGSPHSEAEDTGQRHKEEDKCEITSEMTSAALSGHSDENLSSDTQINSGDQSPSAHSVSADVNHQGSYTEREAEEEEEVHEEEEDRFPPPPPPVFFNEALEVTQESEGVIISSLSSSQPTYNGQTNACTVDHQDGFTSAMSDQSEAGSKPLDMSVAPSRFAQAVALAVLRSRLQSHDKVSGTQMPSDPLSPSPPRSTYQYGA
uniref:Cordon-bleu WH2 repeat protein-like 1a n=1 Tax=Mastacembelus armatus TaxID=205130 RepID=A0A3Q3SUV8_9TELE